MAQFLNILLVMVAIFAKKSTAVGGIEERLQRQSGRQDQVNQEQPKLNENIDKLVQLLKKDTLKDLCGSEKVNPVWCQYKELLELNNAYQEQQRVLEKKSSRSLCWPGLPWRCKTGLAPGRAARDVVSDTDDTTDNDDDKRGMAMRCRPGLATCRNNGKRGLQKPKPKPHCPQGWLFCV